MQLPPVPPIQSLPNLARAQQFSVVIVSHYQRLKRRAAFVSAHHELLRRTELVFEPVSAPVPGLIYGSAPLRDDALQFHLLRRRDHAVGRSIKAGREADRGAVYDFGKPGLSVLDRTAAPVVALEVEQIKCIVKDRPCCGFSILQELERWLARGTEGDDFAVEHCGAGVDGSKRGHDAGEVFRS